MVIYTRRALWCSRHAPTEAQMAQIGAAGDDLQPEDIALGQAWGARLLTSEAEVDALLAEIAVHIARVERDQTYRTQVRLYGVWPVPLLARSTHALAWNTREIMAAWNVQRTADGPPQFTHYRWLSLGHLALPIPRPEHVPGCPRAVTRVDPDEPSYFGA
jgi:hypothetical protein